MRRSALGRGAVGRWCTITALQPAAYARAVAAVDITEPALEIGFLAGHYAVTDDEREGHQHQQEPEIVERDGQAGQAQKRGEVDGVAREAVRSAPDDGGGRQVGGTVRTGPGDRHDGPGEQPSARTKTIAPSQRAGSWAGRNDKGTMADLIAFANAGAVTLHYRSTKRRLHYA